MDYKNFEIRLADIGLNLRDAIDKVEEGEWTVLSNIRSQQEARIQTREGRTSYSVISGTDPVHTLRRLTDSYLLEGVGTNVYRDTTLLGSGFSGNPLSVIPFRQVSSPDIWDFIGDTTQMRVVKNDGTNYKWGITEPSTAATFAASTVTGVLDSSVGSGYQYKYTYKNSTTGARSNGSAEGTAVSIVLKKGRVTIQASGDAQVDSIEIWRKGGTLSSYHLVTTTTNTTQTLEENNSDVSIALNETLPEDNFVPFTSIDSSGNYLYGVPIPFLWGPFLGKTIFGCGDENRKGVVYYTNDNRPHSAGRNNYFDVTGPQEPLQNGCIYGVSSFAFSAENLYGIRYGSSISPTYSSFPTPCGRGLVNPYALAVGPYIYFQSKDGIYQTDGQSPAICISEELRPIFHGQDVGTIPAVTFGTSLARNNTRMAFHEKDLHFFYPSASEYIHLIYNTQYKRWKQATSSYSTDRLGYSDEASGSKQFFIGGSDGKVVQTDTSVTTDPSSTTISCRAKTGSFDFGAPNTLKELGNLIIDADPKGNTLTITPYLNAETSSLASQQITGSGRQKFSLSLSDTYAYSLALDFQWSGNVEVYAVTVQFRPDEESVKHWEFPETSHSLTGLSHIRDGYICLRSTADVTFTHTIVQQDGVQVVNTYTLPSTSGERKKVYVEMNPGKGTLYRYALDSSAPFRLYGEDCEIRVKPWNTNLGYQLVTPFK